jgi:hypothetical protein
MTRTGKLPPKWSELARIATLMSSKKARFVHPSHRRFSTSGMLTFAASAGRPQVKRRGDAVAAKGRLHDSAPCARDAREGDADRGIVRDPPKQPKRDSLRTTENFWGIDSARAGFDRTRINARLFVSAQIAAAA